jgi:hypothetical protein
MKFRTEPVSPAADDYQLLHPGFKSNCQPTEWLFGLTHFPLPNSGFRTRREITYPQAVANYSSTKNLFPVGRYPYEEIRTVARILNRQPQHSEYLEIKTFQVRCGEAPRTKPKPSASAAARARHSNVAEVSGLRRSAVRRAAVRLTDLPDQIRRTLCYPPAQNLISILRAPDQVILQMVNRVPAMPVFRHSPHSRRDRAAESRPPKRRRDWTGRTELK